MRSPIGWFGGKGNMVRKIIPILTRIPHERYVEPFGGGASILLAKKPKPVEVYNDLDHGLYDFFSVLSNPELFDQFYRRVAVLPYSRQFYNEYRKEWKEEADKIVRVAKWFLVARQSFSGAFGGSWSSSVTLTRRGMIATCSKWLSCIDMLPQIHARLQRVQIENADFRTILDRYDTPKTLFYCDPPYIPETCKGGGYLYEMSAEDHQELVNLLLGLKGNVVLSGYNHEIYAPLEKAKWTLYDFHTACYASGRTRSSGLQGKGKVLEKQSRIESLWVKPCAEGRLF